MENLFEWRRFFPCPSSSFHFYLNKRKRGHKNWNWINCLNKGYCLNSLELFKARSGHHPLEQAASISAGSNPKIHSIFYIGRARLLLSYRRLGFASRLLRPPTRLDQFQVLILQSLFSKVRLRKWDKVARLKGWGTDALKLGTPSIPPGRLELE